MGAKIIRHLSLISMEEAIQVRLIMLLVMIAMDLLCNSSIDGQ